MPAFVNASNVRTYAHIDGISEPWSESNLSSNIRAASSFLEKRTGRQFDIQTATTKTFTTNGEAYISLPGLRTATNITLAGTALTLDTDAWLIPDSQQTGVYIGLQFRPFGRRGGYRSFPDWFDTNKDSWRWPGNWGGSDANDLTITGDWGYSPLPDELLHATKALALWFTKRPDASLSNAIQTPEGNVFDLSGLPVEVTEFIRAWKLDAPAVASVG